MRIKRNENKFHPLSFGLQEVDWLLFFSLNEISEKWSKLTPEQKNSIVITEEDFLKALERVQPSAKREGFATIPDVTSDDVGGVKEFKKRIRIINRRSNCQVCKQRDMF